MNQRAAAEVEANSRVSALELARRAMEQQGQQPVSQPVPQTTTQPAVATTTAQATSAAPTSPAGPPTTSVAPPLAVAPQSITQEQLNEILSLMRQLFPTGQVAASWLQASGYMTNDPSRLTGDQANLVLVDLNKMVAEKQQPGPTAGPTAASASSASPAATAQAATAPADTLTEPESKFVAAMKAHDWYYQMSDDGSVFSRGQSSEGNVHRLALAIPESQRVELWARFSPSREGVQQFSCPGVSPKPDGNTPAKPQFDLAPQTAPSAAPISVYKVTELTTVMKQVFATGQDGCDWLTVNFGTNDPAKLTEAQHADAMIELTKQLADRKMAASNASKPALDATNGNTAAPGSVTDKQREDIRGLTMHIYGDRAAAESEQFLVSLGLNTARNLSYAQAQLRIAQLNQDPRAANWVPF